MNTLNVKLLTQLLEATKYDVYGYLARFLEHLGYSVIMDGYNYIVGIPEQIFEFDRPKYCPVALVAHMDTLVPSNRQTGKFLRPMDLVQIDHIVLNRSGVLGADDRAGVYAILHLIQTSEYKPIVVFTNDEEIGGLGVKELIRRKALEPYLDYINLFIELDRQGSDDFVYYSNYLPSEVDEFAQRAGFIESYGSYSDVADLTDEYLIPHLNLSIGYYNQHKVTEYLNLIELEATIDRVAGILAYPGDIPQAKIDPNKGKWSKWEDEYEPWQTDDRFLQFYDWKNPKSFMTQYYEWLEKQTGAKPDQDVRHTQVNNRGYLPIGASSGTTQPTVITYQEGPNTYLVYDGQEYLVGQNRKYVVDLKDGTVMDTRETRRALAEAGLTKPKKKKAKKVAQTQGNIRRIEPELGGSRSVNRSRSKRERLIEAAELPWVRR